MSVKRITCPALLCCVPAAFAIAFGMSAAANAAESTGERIPGIGPLGPIEAIEI